MTASDKKSSSIDFGALLTQAALVIILVICATRATMTETVRDSLSLGTLAAGDQETIPGPATTLVLDFCCWIPVVLILVRRAIDPSYILRWQKSFVLLILLCMWMAASTFWASDRFAACIGVSTWCAGLAIAWSTSQLVRSWTRLRFVLAMGVGLLAAFFVQTAMFNAFEVPQLQKAWPPVREQMMRDNHWSPDDFLAKKWDAQIAHPEQRGFTKSANSFAAAIALCVFVTVGFAGQRLLDRDSPLFPIALATLPLAGIVILIATGSKTAMIGAGLFAILLAIAWQFRAKLAASSVAIFWAGVAIVLAGAAIVIAIGVKTGGLLQDSLTFRWNYWVASWRLFLMHPWRGVGWNNFGDAYLAFRLPVAAEEIKDPHNFIVHFLTETGAIGAAICIAWIGRALFEITRPTQPRETKTKESAFRLLAIVLAGFCVLRFVVTFPVSISETEPLKLLLFVILMAAAMAMAVVRSKDDVSLDDRPAPAVLYASIVAVLGFLLHNLVDFAMFETGPWVVLMLILGALLGARTRSVAGRKTHNAAAYLALGAVFLGLIGYVALLLGPVAVAAAYQRRADAAAIGGRYTDAAALYRDANSVSFISNFEYSQRAARSLIAGSPKDAMAFFSQAIDASPANAGLWLERARLHRQMNDQPFLTLLDYRAAIARNPGDIAMHLELGQYLDSINQPQAAVEEYRNALNINAQYHADEPRRIPKDTADALQARVGK